MKKKMEKMSFKPLEEIKEADSIFLEESLPKKKEQTSADKLMEALQDMNVDSDSETAPLQEMSSFNLKLEAKT